MSAIEMHAATDVGVRRSHNEDCVGITPTHGIAVLADGMGGHNAGEVASAMAVDIITRMLKDQLPRMKEAEVDDDTGFTGESVMARHSVATANDAIYETAQHRPECMGMGTTVVVAVFYADRVTAAHVGDSRMYRLRGDILSHVTEDHSLIQEQVRRGLLTADDARNSSIKNLVTRALGVEPGVDPDIVEDIVQAGDIYLMCSDGLTDVVPDEAIRLTLTEFGRDLRKAAAQLIQLANDAGGPDNISVILIRTNKRFQRKRGVFSRLLGKN
ncbi:MAG TPA: Stp1/IreP family PP2C-type Ser/Thr phosphatase [Mariprofundaceae bacterium]|nr:Stp1/IreP family PP2C-type Ser/Thr phosphatase [Mariprofundaceae bacterium]